MKVLKIVGITIGLLIGAYYLAFGVLYLAGYRIYRIPTTSMQPTIRYREIVIGRVSESYRDRLQRFDLAIYRFPQASGQMYVKRIIGLPGERITVDSGGVQINRRQISLPPAVSASDLGLQKCDIVLPADAVFLLGDNTSNSVDSRFHGPVPTKDVIGYLVFKK